MAYLFFLQLVIMFTQAIFVPLGIIFINGAALPKLNLKVSLHDSLFYALIVLIDATQEILSDTEVPCSLFCVQIRSI